MDRELKNLTLNISHTPSGVTGHGTHLPLRGFATIWPPHRPSCENGG